MISIRSLSAALALSATLAVASPLMATGGSTTGPTKRTGKTSTKAGSASEQTKPARAKEKPTQDRAKEKRATSDFAGYDGLLRGFGYRE
jgi:hypothetical protein